MRRFSVGLGLIAMLGCASLTQFERDTAQISEIEEQLGDGIPNKGYELSLRRNYAKLLLRTLLDYEDALKRKNYSGRDTTVLGNCRKSENNNKAVQGMIGPKRLKQDVSDYNERVFKSCRRILSQFY